ncbi:MAG TPA: zf-HC2 domain-containing protein [Vicinamibacteria bacterium]|nr:zf-HC2 domain-containing protein [Vicinamibacteria bacterium]
MTCERLREILDDYADGSLSEAEHQEAELHLASCAACRSEERKLRAFLGEAAGLRHEAQPGRDLWPGIASRIEARARVLRFARRGGLLAGLAAAAALVLALVIGRTPRPGAGAASVEPGGASVQPAAIGTADIEKAETEYLRATSQLIQTLNARRGSMSPEAQKQMADLEANVAAIDTALREVKDALEKDPQNTKLNKMLASTHQKKIDLLLKLIRLSAQI